MDHRLKTNQRFPFPVYTDKRKHTVFDLVPLTRAGRIMTNRDFHTTLIAELLQEIFPRSVPRSIAPAAIGTNEQPPRMAVMSPTHTPPPLPEALHRGFGR